MIINMRGQLLAATLFLAVGHGVARADIVVENPIANPPVASADQIKAKRAHENPLASPNTSKAKAEGPVATYRQGVRTPDQGASGGGASSRAFGSFGLPYTTGRVVAGKAPFNSSRRGFLSASFPYSAVGLLAFDQGYCSASVIRRSVIVTAAHCIQHFGDGSDTYTNHQFVPAYYGAGPSSQIAPFGIFTLKAFVRPATWANGTDTGSYAARSNDLALIILNKDRSNRFIGDLTGVLGYAWNNYSFVSSSRTGNLAVGAVTTLGYPYLMDEGNIMQRTDGPTYLTTIGGAPQYWQGSNFTGGSSGGPWVVNFRAADAVLGEDAVEGTASRMAVIGVTSWGSADPNAIKDNYSSRFGQNRQYPKADYGGYGAGNIGALLNTLCNTKLKGKTYTYADLHYCD